MAASETARVAPAGAERDPHIERFPGRLERENNLLETRRQGAHLLGVDIGASGALAVLTAEGELVSVYDMPVLADGPAGRRAVNAPLLAELVFKSQATKAFVEQVSARSGEGPTGAFSFGRAKGCVEGVLAAAGVPIQFLTPSVWKRLAAIAPGKSGSKDAARAEAIRRWPERAALFARVRDDGRAEAALIALAGLMREARR